MSQDQNPRTKLTLLADALMQHILAASNEDILAEVDAAHIERARVILLEVKARASKQLLNTAKTQADTWRSLRLREGEPQNRSEAKERFEKIRCADPTFDQKMMIAARNGKAPTDNDKEGLVEDLADLQRLEDEDGQE